MTVFGPEGWTCTNCWSQNRGRDARCLRCGAAPGRTAGAGQGSAQRETSGNTVAGETNAGPSRRCANCSAWVALRADRCHKCGTPTKPGGQPPQPEAPTKPPPSHIPDLPPVLPPCPRCGTARSTGQRVCSVCHLDLWAAYDAQVSASASTAPTIGSATSSGGVSRSGWDFNSTLVAVGAISATIVTLLPWLQVSWGFMDAPVLLSGHTVASTPSMLIVVASVAAVLYAIAHATSARSWAHDFRLPIGLGIAVVVSAAWAGFEAATRAADVRPEPGELFPLAMAHAALPIAGIISGGLIALGGLLRNVWRW